MKKIMKRFSILTILVFVFTMTAPIAKVTFAESCIDGVNCPGDIDNGSDGPKSPPPQPTTKDTSILCKWLNICKIGND